MFGFITKSKHNKIVNKLDGDICFIRNNFQQLELKNTELKNENEKLKKQIMQFRIFLEKLNKYEKMIFSLNYNLSLYTIYYINDKELK